MAALFRGGGFDDADPIDRATAGGRRAAGTSDTPSTRSAGAARLSGAVRGGVVAVCRAGRPDGGVCAGSGAGVCRSVRAEAVIGSTGKARHGRDQVEAALPVCVYI
eukprot:ctg_434.g226